MRPGTQAGTVTTTHEVDEAVVRVIVTAGREASRTPGTDEAAGRPIDAQSYRAVATALVGGEVPQRQLESAFAAFAADREGVVRFEAMVRRAQQSLVRTGDAAGGEVVPLGRVLALTAMHATFLRALRDRRETVDHTYERFAVAAAAVVAAGSYDEACARVAVATRELSRLDGAALYVPGTEQARMVRAATDGGHGLPPWLRVDRDLFADVIAGERPVFVAGREPLEAVSSADAPVRTLLSVPLRDAVRRPVGLIVAVSPHECELDIEAVEALRRLGTVAEGVLASADATRRAHAALGTLPELARVAHRAQLDVSEQLDELAAIVARATDSDAAVIRICDAAGSFLETTAAFSRHDDAVSDVIGARTRLDREAGVEPSEAGLDGEHELVDIDPGGAGWSSAGRRMLDVLRARTVASFPIGSLYQRTGVLYVLRKTARPLDDVDRACARIVTSHVQHVVDRHVSEAQTGRAISAARSAIRLLGEALVAGVRTERTLRFVPRLYHEMFDCQACRVWRLGRDGGISQIASAGQFDDDEPSVAVGRALDEPLRLELATEQRPHVAAVAIDEYQGTRLAIEFQMGPERSLGTEEQALAIDVAARVGEALFSADQAAAHERQLDRVRTLQNVIAAAHEQLSEAHVVATIADEVPAQYGADASAVFVVGQGGRLEARAVRDVPGEVVRAVAQMRGWLPDTGVGEAGAEVLVLRPVGEAEQLASVRAQIEAAGMARWAAAIIPLTGREQTVGALVLLFEDGELPEGLEGGGTMLPAFGRHVGSALLNAREFERERLSRLRIQKVLDVERENSRQVRALHEVSRTFATSLSLDETMRAVVEAMADRLDVDAVWIRTPNDRGDQMLLRAFYATHPELSSALERMVSAPEPRDDPITQKVINERRPELLTGEEARQGPFASSELLRRLQPFLQRGSTIAVLPVAKQTEVLGTLTMLSIDPEHALTFEKVDVASGVTSQAALALDNARLYQAQKSFAEIIQESLLPGRLPDIPGLDLGVLYRSATVGGADAPTIGGDFYDFLELEDGRLALAVGDVTGKGVGAAADTAMTKYIFRALAREHPSPAGFLRYANEVVCEEITPGKFVTLFYAVIDPRRGTMICGNAGHPEPKIVQPVPEGSNADPDIVSVGLEGLALGIIPDQDYEQREYEFVPGASLVVYTDGVVEARRESRLYGQYRLERRLADEVGASAPQLAFAVYHDCASYAEDGLADDVAIVVVQRLAEEQ